MLHYIGLLGLPLLPLPSETHKLDESLFLSSHLIVLTKSPECVFSGCGGTKPRQSWQISNLIGLVGLHVALAPLVCVTMVGELLSFC